MTASVTKLGPLGPYDNNAYLIVDHATKHSIVVDAPIGSEHTVEAARGSEVQMIIVTHRHRDHWAEIDVLKERLAAPVFCHEGDRPPYAEKVTDTLGDGAEVTVGESVVRIIHTPGHTPGSICLLVDGVLMSGDTLFPGGPGRSDNADALRELVGSIATKLLTLPEDTAVYPGHGDNTTIGAAKREHAAFMSRPHPDDLCGDVTWDM